MNKLLFFTLLSLLSRSFAEKLLLCYYGSWATYRNGNGACHVKDLDPFMCTHLIYTFVGLNDDASIRIMDPWLDLPDNWGRDNFGEFNRLKNVNPELKTIVAIGGWNEMSAKYSKMAHDPALRAKFVKNASNFTKKYGFDGFDLDWEYPGQRDSPYKESDIQAHTQLLKELRDEFDEHGLLLTAAVAAVKASASLSYNIPAVAQYLDLINVMAYDLHGAWDEVTGHNAALNHYEENVAAEDSYDVETAINYWLSQGAPKEKLILGMPLYGRTFKLTNTSNTGVGAPSNGPGLAGQYTFQNGMIGLNELCEKRLSQTWDEHWDETAQVPYTFQGNDWITYDNHKSLQLKCQLAMEKDLGGVMIWSIETDDFKGVCHNGEKYAYLRTINKAIGRTVDLPSTEAPTTSSSMKPIPTTSPTSTISSIPTSPSSTTIGSSSSTTQGNGGLEKPCKTEGYFRDPDDCSIFYVCVKNGDEYIKYTYNCPKNLYFNDELNICDYKCN